MKQRPVYMREKDTDPKDPFSATVRVRLHCVYTGTDPNGFAFLAYQKR